MRNVWRQDFTPIAMTTSDADPRTYPKLLTKIAFLVHNQELHFCVFILSWYPS